MRGRKLYYDVTLTAENPSAVFPVTKEGEDQPGDRYGAYLDTIAAADGNAPTDERQRREVTAYFQPLGPVAGAFLYLSYISGDAEPPTRTRFQGPAGFQGPIVLNFDSPVNPATAVIGDSVILDCTREDMTFELEVVGSTILIHLTGPGPVDDWVDLGMDLAIGLTVDLEDTEGDALANPGVKVEYEWVNI